MPLLSQPVYTLPPVSACSPLYRETLESRFSIKGLICTLRLQQISLRHFLLQIRISMPESVRTQFVKMHNGVQPEKIFSLEPLALVIDNILAGVPPGVWLETTLEMDDDTKLNINQLPERWKNRAAPQIPGLSGITIKV